MKNKLTRLSLILLVGIVAFAGIILVVNPFTVKPSSPSLLVKAPAVAVSATTSITTVQTTSATTSSQNTTAAIITHHHGGDDNHRTNSSGFGSPDD